MNKKTDHRSSNTTSITSIKRRQSKLSVLFKNKLVLFSIGYLIIMAILALSADIIAPYPSDEINLDHRFVSPCTAYPFGTDQLGRDVLSRMIFGTRTTMGASFAVVLFAAFLGTSIGLVSGYFRKADNVLMRATDLFMAFPPLIGGLALMTFLGPSITNIVIALCIVFTPRVARIARGETLVIREMTYIQAAKSMRTGTVKILFGHILPNALSPLIVYFTLLFSAAIITEAGLSFLGIGAPPEVSSWGIILSDGRRFMRDAWWLTVIPGFAIFLAVLACNLLGDGIRDVSDPRQYGK